jgi:predicted permease
MYDHQVSAPPENKLTVKKTSYGNLETENEMEQLASGARKRANRFLDFFHSINKFMSPPLWAALLGLVVGLTPPLKSIMYSKDSFVYASLTRSIESCGKASVPIVLISLGAQLHSMQLNDKHISDQKMKKPVALSIFIRMILAPMCVIPIVWLFSKLGQHISNLAIDPMFIVAMIIMGCTPTAINLTQITQVTGAFEVEMLHVLFWSYGVICIPVCTFVVFISLTIVS